MGLPLVLIVDDDDGIRQFVKEILEEEGYAVATACNGLEAIEFLGAGPARPVVVLLDLMMPVLTGWDVMSIWREQGRLPTLPVVVFTAATQHAPPEGAVSYLSKPSSLAPLLDAISAASA